MRSTLLLLMIFSFRLAFSQEAANGAGNDKPGQLPGNDKTYKEEQDRYLRQGLFFVENAAKQRSLSDSAVYYLRKAIYLGDSSNPTHSTVIYKCLLGLGAAYTIQKKTDQGLKIFDQVVSGYRLIGEPRLEAAANLYAARWLSFCGSKPVYALQKLRAALRIYQKSGSVKEVIDTRLQIADVYFINQQYDSANVEYNASLMLSGTAKNYRITGILMAISCSNRYAGNLSAALQSALKAVKSLDKKTDSMLIGNSYGELALVYQELNNPVESINWFRQCINVRAAMGDERYIYFTTYLMVVQMIKAGQAMTALRELNELVARLQPSGRDDKINLYHSYAFCYNAIRDYTKAEDYFLKMIDEYRSVHDRSEESSIAHFDIGKFYVENGQFKKGQFYLNQFTYIGSSRQAMVHYLLFKVDSANGDYLNAIAHLQSFRSLNDSIYSAEKSKQIQELLIQYEAEKKDKNIQQLENDRKTAQSSLLRAQQTRNWMLGIAVLLMVITGLLIYTSRIRQLSNTRLRLQQKEIAEKNETLQQLVKEKEWLVREIHHRVKNNFHTVMGLLGTQSQFLKSEEATRAILESQHRIQAMSLIHQRLYQSENMSAVNMNDYIHELVNYLADSFNLTKSIHFRVAVENIELDLAHCIPIGLIINEAVTNSIKYAFPDEKGIVFISLRHEGAGQFRLSIRDNGKGLPPDFNLKDQWSMGLSLISGLAGDLDGDLSITGENGTHIQIRFHTDQRWPVEGTLETENLSL